MLTVDTEPFTTASTTIITSQPETDNWHGQKAQCKQAQGRQNEADVITGSF